MSDKPMHVLIALFGAPGAAKRDFEALVRLHINGVIKETKGIVLVTSDSHGKVDAREAGGGLLGKLVGHNVKRGLRSELPPESGSVVAIFDSAAKDHVDRAVTHAVRKAFAEVKGDDSRALDEAFAQAETILEGPLPTTSSVAPVDLATLSLPGKKILVNGLHMHVSDQGRGEEVVLMLHGMPDTSACWKYQVPELVLAGYRVIVPDLIGNGLSDKPEELDHYVSGQVVEDLAALLDTLGIGKVHLVGHDWGAEFCWEFAMTHPERVGRMVVLSVGHPEGHVADNLFSFGCTRWDWFPIMHTHPKTPQLYAAADCMFFRMVFGTHPELESVIARNLTQPEGFGPTLRWDVANAMTALWLRALTDPNPLPEVHAPVLGIWSDGDVFCFEHQMKNSGAYLNGPWRYDRISDAGHWISLDAPHEVSRLILEWLRESDLPGGEKRPGSTREVELLSEPGGA